MRSPESPRWKAPCLYDHLSFPRCPLGHTRQRCARGSDHREGRWGCWLPCARATLEERAVLLRAQGPRPPGAAGHTPSPAAALNRGSGSHRRFALAERGVPGASFPPFAPLGTRGASASAASASAEVELQARSAPDARALFRRPCLPRVPFFSGGPGAAFRVFILPGFLLFLAPVVRCPSVWKTVNHSLFSIAFVPFSLLASHCQTALNCSLEASVSVSLILPCIFHHSFPHACICVFSLALHPVHWPLLSSNSI